VKDLLANPDVVKIIAAWRRHSRGARLVQEYFDCDADKVVEFLNSQLTIQDMARDLAKEPPEFRQAVMLDTALFLSKPKGDC